MRSASKSDKICDNFARFLAKFCTISNADIAQSRVKNSAITLTTTASTLCVFCNAQRACQQTFTCAVHQNRTKFATNSRAFSRNCAQFRTPTSRNLAAKRSADSAKSCADVVRVAQRTRCTPAELYMRGASKSNKICNKFARFLAKFYIISNPDVAQSRRQPQR